MYNSESKQIKIGIVLSYITSALSSLIPFLYTPIMLELLGQSEYGLYKIAGSTTSFLGLMSFGIGSALSRYLIKANVEQGKEAEENVLGLFMLIFRGIALLTLAVGAVLVWKLDVFYAESLTPYEFRTIRILVAIMALNTAISFSTSPYDSVTSSHERFVFIQLVNLITTVIPPIVNLIVLYLGYKSIGLTITSLVLSIIARIVCIIYVRNNMQIRPRYENMPKDTLKEILVFSFWVFIANIVGQLYNATDTVIIGMIPGLATTGAAKYNIGTTFTSIVSGLSVIIPVFFTPKANKMVFSGCSDEELTDLVIRTGRIQASIVMLIVGGFVAFGRQFINFYVGPDYKTSYWVAIIIMIPNCIPLVQSTALSILQAKNQHKYRSLMYLGIAVLNVVFTALLVNKYGIIGASIPTGVALILGQGLFMNWFYWKRMHLDIPRFWKSVFPFFIVGLILCVITLVLSNVVDFYVLWILIIGIVIYSFVYFLLLWKYVLNSDEKNIFSFTMKRMLKRSST